MGKFAHFFDKQTSKLGDWLSPPYPDGAPLTHEMAEALTDRDRFSTLLSYREFDKERDLFFFDDGEQPAVGFSLAYFPLLVAGTDAEPQLEAVVNACPPDSVVQFSVLSSPYVLPILDRWTKSRTEQTDNALLRLIAERRRDFMLASSMGPSLLANGKMHPRNIQYFASVRIPFKGDCSDENALETWLDLVMDLRDTVQGALQGAGLMSFVMNESMMKNLLRELLNPHYEPVARAARSTEEIPLMHELVEKETCVRLRKDGTLGFSRNPNALPAEDDVRVSCLTIDHLPKELYLPNLARLLGDPVSREDRITPSFWAYTLVHVLDPDKSRERLTGKLGALNKQTMSESDWYKSMMGHLFTRRDDINNLLQVTRSGRQMVRMYGGINLISRPNTVKRDTEYVSSLWRRAGFRASQEKFISLPVYLASLPFQYTPSMDPPNKGLQRMVTTHSLNAASMAFCQGDWVGTSPAQGGPLLISRRGQLCSFNLLNTVSNYNFVIVANSGSGKSYLANEIVADFLSKDGIVRIIDVGRSYARFAEIMGGRNMVFDPQKPVSMNPFYGIKDERDLAEMLPMLKALMRQMAYPIQAEADTPAWEYAAIEAGIVGAWEKHRDVTELSHVYQWLIDHGDERAKDLAFQLQPYATGRYAPWFSGPRQLAFDNDMVVVELEELNSDPELKTVVLTLAIHQITKEMYLSGRERPKLLAIDEAWDLLGNVKTGKFIETAFRRARKYNGIAGVITQSFEDFERSEAARAAIENAAWQFVLYQRPESLEFAARNKRVVADEYLLNMLRSVKPGEGFSEVYVRSETGQGVYRFITDRHSYYTFTTKPSDINKIDALLAQGLTVVQAIDKLATDDYREMWKDK